MQKALQNILIQMQRDEAESQEIYTRLAKKEKNEENKNILQSIAEDEKKHYIMLRELTKKDVQARRWRVSLYIIISKILGLTFGLKLMEIGESQAQESYTLLWQEYPEILRILEDEEQHERELINMLHEAKLSYMWSIVLGLNDALVELTGALAWFTFAIQNSRSIALIWLITGISASFSMAASEFLSQRQEQWWDIKQAIISSVYTGCAYIGTVIFLVTPYFLISNPFYALLTTLWVALLIIWCFNFYISIAKDYNFTKRFTEMALISLCVALISFFIGVLVKVFFGLEV